MVVHRFMRRLRPVRLRLLQLVIGCLAVPAGTAFAQSATATDIAGARFASTAATSARFSLGLSRNQGQTFETTALTTDSIRIIGTIVPEATQLNQPAQIYVVAESGGRFFMRNASGAFVPWDGSVAALLPFRSNEVLGARHPVDFLTGSIPLPGRFNLFLGYQGSDNVLVYSRTPYSIDISAPASPNSGSGQSGSSQTGGSTGSTGSGGTSGGSGSANAGNTRTEPPSQANGYTGITADVLTIQQFECEARSEHEWYRTGRTLLVDPKNPDILYTSVEHRGIFKSVDGGKTWQQKTRGIKVYARSNDTSKGCYGEYPVMRMNPLNSNHLVIGLSGPGGGFLDPDLPNSQVGGVYQSFDGGDSWQLMITNRMNVYVTDVAFDPVNPDTIYYATASNPASWGGSDQSKLYVEKGLIYKTTDRGKTWVELPTGIGQNSSVTNLLINAQQPNQISAPTFSAARLSADGTGTGISTGKDTTLQQLGILTTTDGTTWSSQKPPDNPSLTRGFASKNNWQLQYYVPSQSGSAGTPSGLFSGDGGKTFVATSYMDIVAYDPYDSSGLHAVGYSTVLWTPSDAFYTLYESLDGGRTWRPLGRLPKEIVNPNNAKTRPSNLQWGPQNNRTLYMNGAGGLVWMSTDLGTTWTKLLDYTQL